MTNHTHTDEETLVGFSDSASVEKSESLEGRVQKLEQQLVQLQSSSKTGFRADTGFKVFFNIIKIIAMIFVTLLLIGAGIGAVRYVCAIVFVPDIKTA
ncbi:hypothetical protein CJU90_4993 [Yarrowia sp. C11]|nr:hypothetical protein CJU90_4993 [Yarrowia sp. C11]KAG5364796.1 hypothetical protein CKK34_3621 [Yarrowia sp. E02]